MITQVATPRAPYDQKFHLILNLAAGGDWPGNPDTGWTVDREMLVDYVRVRVDHVQLGKLRVENAEQRAKIESFDQSVADLSRVSGECCALTLKLTQPDKYGFDGRLLKMGRV